MSILSKIGAQPRNLECFGLTHASENPVRGSLLIGKGLPNNLLFVFRRRELKKTLESAIPSRIVAGIKTAKPAPPKNKTGEFRSAVVAINRQPLTGFWRIVLATALT
jgi:hypothetical protein